MGFFIIFLFLQLSSHFPSDTKQTSIVTHVLHTYDWGSSILLCVLLAVMQGLCVSITHRLLCNTGQAGLYMELSFSPRFS